MPTPCALLLLLLLSLWSVLLATGCQPDYGQYEPALTRFDGTALPVVVIDTQGERIRDEPKRMASMQVFAEGIPDLAALRTDGNVRLAVEK